MKLDMARLRGQVVDVLISDLAKCFDAIAQDVHPIVGNYVGPGNYRPPLRPHTGV